MIDLSVNYMGLRLKSPLVAGSSGITNSVASIVDLEKQGAGAVVLKSLFEEQIIHEIHHSMSRDESLNQYPEALDYISNYSRSNSIDRYLDLISSAKAAAGIPIIASINCATAGEWTEYARYIQDAGADALELNMFVLPSDVRATGAELEQLYISILQGVLKKVSIPVAVKLSPHFSGLANMIQTLAWAGAKSLVLFNRFHSPDIDIDALKTTSAPVFSTPADLYPTLRWTALLSGKVQCDIAASTGVHDAEAMIKMLLAGARTVQVASALYKHGSKHLAAMTAGLLQWMGKHNFGKISDFEGKLSYRQAQDPVAYERIQFMKYFAGIE